ncbi:MAG: hypothetical protein N4A32_06965 [Marinifilaceae bacterium]|jgi:hypothetical protein|nr:hypothetical protein [Marinifilaceae bacterium]
MKRLFCFLVLAVFVLSCTKNTSKPLKKEKEIIDASVIQESKIVQPIPSDKNIKMGKVIGFWDFEKDGKNSVDNESGDWDIENAQISNGFLDLSVYKYYRGVGKLQELSVSLYDHRLSKYIGLHQRRYFSGAVKFKILKDSPKVMSFITFGLVNRFLSFRINGNILQICTTSSKLIKKIDIGSSFIKGKWNVMYFRYEDFSANGKVPSEGNKLYVQINKNKEFIIDFETIHLDLVAQSSDISLGFVNQSRGECFKGLVDWVIMSVGRMTPENAQYRIQELK